MAGKRGRDAQFQRERTSARVIRLLTAYGTGTHVAFFRTPADDVGVWDCSNEQITRTCFWMIFATSTRREGPKRLDMAATLMAAMGFLGGNATPTAAVPGVATLSRNE